MTQQGKRLRTPSTLSRLEFCVELGQLEGLTDHEESQRVVQFGRVVTISLDDSESWCQYRSIASIE